MSDNEYQKEFYKKRRDTFIASLGGRCDVCGTTDNLEIDHIDPKKKLLEINPFAALDKTLEELKKCHLLCEKHHMEKTVSEKSPFIHGTVYSFMKKHCPCEECVTAKERFNAKRNETRRLPMGSGGRGPYNTTPYSHGDGRMYHRGCRCDLCREEHAARARKFRQKNKLYAQVSKLV